MYSEQILRSVIDKNLSYKDRQEVISMMSESAVMKEAVFGNIGNYFYKKLAKLKLGTFLAKYADSKGNVTKTKGYDNTVVALNMLKHDARPDVAKHAMIVEEALLNLTARRPAFELGFKSKNGSLTRLIYAVMNKAVISATSVLICESSTVHTGQAKPFNHDMINVMTVFNKLCKDGTVDKMIRHDVNLGNRAVKEGVFDTLRAAGDVLSVGAYIGSALITGIRSLVYWVYYTRIDIADYFEQQAAYIETNKIAVQNRKDLNEAKKKEIIKKQTEWQERLMSLSDMIQVDDIKAARKAKEQAEKDGKDMKGSDATSSGSDEGDQVPDFF